MRWLHNLTNKGSICNITKLYCMFRGVYTFVLLNVALMKGTHNIRNYRDVASSQRKAAAGVQCRPRAELIRAHPSNCLPLNPAGLSLPAFAHCVGRTSLAVTMSGAAITVNQGDIIIKISPYTGMRRWNAGYACEAKVKGFRSD